MRSYPISCIIHAGAYYTPIAYTLPDGLQSVNGSSSTGGCQPESCVMAPYGGSTINGCDCPGTTGVNGTLIDRVIPIIDTTRRGTWASELFVVDTNGGDSLVIGFEFNDHISFRIVEVTYLDCQIWGAGTSAITVYSSFSFPTFFQLSSDPVGEISLLEDEDQSCTSLKTVYIPTQPMSSFNFYVEFSFTGVSSVRPLNWLHLAEIRFSDTETPSTFTTTAVTTTESVPSSTKTTTDGFRSISTAETVDESVFGSESGDGQRDTITLLPNSTLDETNITASSEPLSTTLGSADVSVIPITSIVGGLIGVIAILLLLLIVGGTVMTYLIIRHRLSLDKIASDSPLEHHYAAIGNPNVITPSLELQNLSSPSAGEERRPSTAINGLYEPMNDFEIGEDNTNSNIVLASVSGGDVVYSEIRDMPGRRDSMGQSMVEETARDTDSVDLYGDDDSIQENLYAIIPEMYMLATPVISQVQLNVRPKSADVSLATASHGSVGELLQPEQNEKSYSLVHKQCECPPPVPEKSIELQQYLTVTLSAAAERSDQQQGCGEQADPNNC